MTAQHLKTLRAKAKLTQKQLAAKIGKHRITIAKYEGGQTIPRAVEIAILKVIEDCQ